MRMVRRKLILLLSNKKLNGTKTHCFSLFFREKVRFRAKIFNLAASWRASISTSCMMPPSIASGRRMCFLSPAVSSFWMLIPSMVRYPIASQRRTWCIRLICIFFLWYFSSDQTFGESGIFWVKTFGESGTFWAKTFGESGIFWVKTFGESGIFWAKTFGESGIFVYLTFPDFLFK